MVWNERTGEEGVIKHNKPNLLTPNPCHAEEGPKADKRIAASRPSSSRPPTLRHIHRPHLKGNQVLSLSRVSGEEGGLNSDAEQRSRRLRCNDDERQTLKDPPRGAFTGFPEEDQNQHRHKEWSVKRTD